MPRTRFVRLSLAVVLAGCASVYPADPSEPLPGPYEAGQPASEAARSYSEALGLPRLETTVLPAGTRELRLEPSVGPFIPDLFVRVLDAPAGASVEWFAVWSVHDHAFMDDFRKEMRRERRCGAIRRAAGVEFCRMAVRTGADARRLVAFLDGLGAWELDDPAVADSSRIIQIDGRSLDVEARAGERYRSAEFLDRHLRANARADTLYAFARSPGLTLD